MPQAVKDEMGGTYYTRGETSFVLGIVAFLLTLRSSSLFRAKEEVDGHASSSPDMKRPIAQAIATGYNPWVVGVIAAVHVGVFLACIAVQDARLPASVPAKDLIAGDLGTNRVTAFRVKLTTDTDSSGADFATGTNYLYVLGISVFSAILQLALMVWIEFASVTKNAEATSNVQSAILWGVQVFIGFFLVEGSGLMTPMFFLAVAIWQFATVGRFALALSLFIGSMAALAGTPAALRWTQKTNGHIPTAGYAEISNSSPGQL